VYYPGTEELKPNEIRIVARGTGMPSARRSQAATCFLVELGDDEKFLFDIGSGSHANIQSLMIPSDFLTKILHYAFTHRPLGRLGLAMGW
jgi:ribonuclease Z